MDTRKRGLPNGWYPDSPSGVGDAIVSWEAELGQGPAGAEAIAAIAPHAGWYYSGKTAWRAWRRAAQADTVVVVGGHRPAGSGFSVARQSSYSTPLGPIRADRGLGELLERELGAERDLAADNTVEVHLPMVRYRFPEAEALWVRAPNDESASRLGEWLAEYSRKVGRRLFVLGSTDLCHYGPNYGWEPAGGGEAGRGWARGADEAISRAFEDMSEGPALELARVRRAACSVGAALAAMSFARAFACRRGELLALVSSLDTAPAESFVGYCAIAYTLS